MRYRTASRTRFAYVFWSIAKAQVGGKFLFDIRAQDLRPFVIVYSNANTIVGVFVSGTVTPSSCACPCLVSRRAAPSCLNDGRIQLAR